MNKLNFQKDFTQKGFTIVELLIGTVVALIVMAGITQVFVGTVKSSGDTLKASKLNQDMQAIMNIMVADIRRAGHWNSLAGSAPTENPFTDATNNMNIVTLAASPAPANDCIMYAYDRPSTSDGVVTPSLPPASPLRSPERLGFKLFDTEGDGTMDVWMRRTGENMTDCTTATGNWQRLNDEGVEEITALSFTPKYKCVNSDTGETDENNDCATLLVDPDTLTGHTLVETRRIIISMAGRLVNDTAVTKIIKASVRVRNDRIFTVP